ncbi:MAG: T9SS type A sorting domain-containing protein, partial [Bacteroidota bacterium]
GAVPSDAGHLAYRTLDGDGTLTARLDVLGSGGGAGITLRAALADDAPRATVLVADGQVRFLAGSGLDLPEVAAATSTAPNWLRLERSAGTVTALLSADGLVWQAIGAAPLALPGASVAGLLARAGTTDLAPTAASFSEVSVQSGGTAPGSLPQPWASRDIGTVLIEGSARFNAGQFTVQGAGDAWGERDAFHYAYRPFTGDGRIAARLFRQAAPRVWAKSGLMFRADLGADAEHVSFYYASERGFHLQYRDARGAETASFFAVEGTPPRWMQLRRSGPLFVASVSDDGVSWTEVGSIDVEMGETLYTGLASTATDIERVGDICIAIFDEVVVEEQPPLDGVLPWVETFGQADGTTADDGETAWTLDVSEASAEAVAEVEDGVLVIGATASEAQPSGSVTWIGEALELDAAGGPIASVTVSSTGSLSASDTLQLRTTLDGETRVAATLIGPAPERQSLVLTSDTLRADRVQLAVRARVGSPAGRYRVERVALAQTPTSAPPPVEGIPRFVIESVYPNPFRSATTLRVALDQPGRYRIEVFDLLGRRVFEQRLREESATVALLPVDLPTGAAGLYVVRVLHEPTGAAVHARVTRLAGG